MRKRNSASGPDEWGGAGGYSRTGLSRRTFLRRSAASAAASWISIPTVRSQLEPDPFETFLRLVGKDQQTIVHNTNPGVLETPLELLRGHNITPKELLFLRNNQVMAGALTLQPLALEPWTIELIGLVKYPRVIGAEELRSAPPSEVEMVLQCSGNGRSLYAQSAPTRGTQWGKGGLGNVRWRGVRLADLIETLQLQVDPSARFVAAEGKDTPATASAADFEHSLPLVEVMEEGLLALEMNGEPIPALHGGPVRLIVPGFYGTMNVKWLHRLRFEAGETTNYNHIPRYRIPRMPIQPGSKFDYTLENSIPTWRQTVKSLIWQPLEAGTRGNRLQISGVAWNDGRVRIEAVEVSVDGGASWLKAELETPRSRYAWYPWQLGLELARGRHQIWARAVDAAGRTQPLDGSIHWNPSGYCWSGVERIQVATR